MATPKTRDGRINNLVRQANSVEGTEVIDTSTLFLLEITHPSKANVNQLKTALAEADENTLVSVVSTDQEADEDHIYFRSIFQIMLVEPMSQVVEPQPEPEPVVEEQEEETEPA